MRQTLKGYNIMDEKNIKKYVYHCSDKFPSIDSMRQMLFVYGFMSLMGSVFGFFGKGPFLVVAILLDILTILHIVFVVVLPKMWNPNEFSHRFMVSGLCAIGFTIYFEVFAFIFIFLEEDSNWVYGYICFMIVGLLICILLSFVLTLRKIKRGKVGTSEKQERKIVGIISISAICGILLGMAILPRLGSRGIIAFCVFLAFVLVGSCSYGTTHFLKYYYVKKYAFPSDGLEDVIAYQLHPPKKKKRVKK